jgi:hypothetical protein
MTTANTNHSNGAGEDAGHDAQRIEEIRRTINLLHPPGPDRLFEIRVLNIKTGRGKPYNAAGYFRDDLVAARSVMAYDKMQSEGIYILLNRPDPLCHARAPDQIVDYLDTTTSDKDIERRTWLILDIDPKRPRGVCATTEQVEAAVAYAQRVKALLTERFGWPAPIEASSGNGYYLIFKVELLNDDDSRRLIERVLKSINHLMTQEN